MRVLVEGVSKTFTQRGGGELEALHDVSLTVEDDRVVVMTRRPGRVLKVVLPSALPMILAGYRLGAGIALLLVVSAEMINATAGIGFLILNSGDLMLTGKLMVGLVLLSLLGLGSTWGLRVLETYLVPWKEDAR